MKLKAFISVLLTAVLLCGCTAAPVETTTENDTTDIITTDTKEDTKATETTAGAGTETEVGTDTETEGETVSVTETEPETETETEPVTETETEKTPETTKEEETTKAPETTKEEETTKAPETTKEAETTKEKETAPETTKAPETEKETETVTDKAPETETETEEIDETTTVTLSVPAKSDTVSHKFARELLELCTGGNETANGQNLVNAGFELLLAKNYNKPSSDKSHTSAYTVGRGKYNGKNMYAIVIRGTSGGEWYSNFDFAPSHNNDTQYAENFKLAAEDVYRNVKSILEADKNAYIIVCGHSRGAAVSNLLGVLLDGIYDSKNIYVYTFATPGTVRGDAAKVEYKNIFNYLNPNDAVTHVPLEEHGYKRAGTDIKLKTFTKPSEVITALSNLSHIAPTIKSYYEDKHSLTAAGLSDDGMTVFEVMNYLCTILNSQTPDMSKLAAIQPESDLYPIVLMLNKFSDTTQAMAVASEHMPIMYNALMMML